MSERIKTDRYRIAQQYPDFECRPFFRRSAKDFAHQSLMVERHARPGQPFRVYFWRKRKVRRFAFDCVVAGLRWARESQKAAEILPLPPSATEWPEVEV